MIRRTVATAAVLFAVGAVAAACGAEDDTALPRVTSSSSATPAPTSEPRWAPDAKPQRPADDQSVEGARAFTEFAADTVLYVMATGDAPALTSIAELATCEDCRRWDSNFNAGKIKKVTIMGGPATYRLLARPTVTDTVYYQVRLGLNVPRGKSVSREDGSKLDDIDAAKNMPFKADIRWKDDQWTLLRYDLG